MQYRKFSKSQRLEAKKMHAKCSNQDTRKLRRLKGEVENGVYRITV